MQKITGNETTANRSTAVENRNADCRVPRPTAARTAATGQAQITVNKYSNGMEQRERPFHYVSF